MLVASPLLLLLAEDLAVIRIVVNEEDEDGEDGGETTGAEEERDVLMVEGNFGGGEWFDLAILRARVRVSESRVIVELFPVRW